MNIIFKFFNNLKFGPIQRTWLKMLEKDDNMDWEIDYETYKSFKIPREKNPDWLMELFFHWHLKNFGPYFSPIIVEHYKSYWKNFGLHDCEGSFDKPIFFKDNWYSSLEEMNNNLKWTEIAEVIRMFPKNIFKCKV